MPTGTASARVAGAAAGDGGTAPPLPDHDRTPPKLLLYGVQALALVVIGVAQHYKVIAHESMWAYAAAIILPSLASGRLDRWIDAPRGSWRLHVRVLVHAATAMTVIYMTGWGPALGVCFVYSALVDLLQSGPSSWRAVLGWSLVCCSIGQFLVFHGWMPSELSSVSAQVLGGLGACGFGIVIVMAGAVGERQRKAEILLAQREALHREVVANLAEGVFTLDLDGTIISFNAAAEAIFGWAERDIVGRPASLTLTEDLRKHLDRYFEAVRRDGPGVARRQGSEALGVRRDGSEFPMLVSLSALSVEGTGTVITAIVRDLSDQKEIEALLQHQALHDALTGLANRAMLMDRIDQALNRVRRHHRLCAVLYVDLDRFKAVNDSLGHAFGDKLLVEATARIGRCVRETDTVARVGGDEFVVLCEGLDSVQDATDIAERMMASICEPYRFGDDDARVGASIGIALSRDGSGTAEPILANADIAMYRAKKNGRARYELFDETMQRWVTDQAALDLALRQALPRDEFEVLYQPIVDSGTGVVRGFEALLRWERPGFGTVAPDDFIPMAEESGLIVDIGAWVLERACGEVARWVEHHPGRRLGLAVNVSSRQLANRDIVDMVTEIVERTGLDPRALTLEITESTLVDDTVSTRAILEELRALGVNLSLDDFGTGYSSLTYLRTFPISIVKIDKSFVRAIGTQREDTAIVAAVVALARNLDIAVVAEGVETPEQLAVLQALQCPYAQGYLFSKPRRANEAEALLDMPAIGPAGMGTDASTAPTRAPAALLAARRPS